MVYLSTIKTGFATIGICVFCALTTVGALFYSEDVFMICCFMNLHEKENAKDLKKHFDKEIEHAISFGCSVFMAGKSGIENEIFKERVMIASRHYKDGEITFLAVDKSNEELKDFFIQLADWEIYSYEC